MPARFVNLDRQTPMFRPCDRRDGVPSAHFVHFILDAVEQLPTAHFHVHDRGTGSEPDPPAMMLALRIDGYATGRFGSRTIEAATPRDGAGRYLGANAHPDPDSICAFRVANQAAFRAAFVTVLQLAHQLRLTQVGTVSVEGTKIQANASKHAAVSYARAGEMVQQLELEVQDLLERAETADPRESQETLDIPAELARRDKRVAAMKQARAVIEARARELAKGRQSEYEARQAARQAPRDAGKSRAARNPFLPAKRPLPRRSTTSPIRRAGS